MCRSKKIFYCVKYRNFIKFPGMRVLRKRTIDTEFWAIYPKLCESCAFSQSFHTRKFGEISVFCVVVTESTYFVSICSYTLSAYKLIFYGPMSLSYRNQSVDLQTKSTDWFLYDRNIGR